MNRVRTGRSLVVPVILASAAFALATCLFLYLATLWVVRSDSDASLAQGVDIELAALADVFATGGLDETAARISDRLALRGNSGDDAHYLLADADGKRIAGDIQAWPMLSAENSQAGFLTINGDIRVFARATQLAPGVSVIAAREYGQRSALIAHLNWVFALAAILVLIASLLLAWRYAARLGRRVSALNDAFDAVQAGALDQPVPGRSDEDELGALSRHAEQLIGRLSHTLKGQRAITDQVAHEIRTPLAHLDSRLLRIIAANPDPDQVAALGAVRRDARGIADMLDSLLDIAASETRRGDRSGLERIDLSAVAQDVVDLYADSADEAGHRLSANLTPQVTIAGDAMQLTRMFSNLLDNAFKYAGPGAGISVSVEQGPRIVVADNGPGVAAPLRQTMFEPFRRAGPGPGHGLGLALVRAIAERHGLSIRYEDGQPGAMFILEGERS